MKEVFLEEVCQCRRLDERATLIIKYEDLVNDPVKTFSRVEKLIPLPPANWDRLPNFQEMKAGKAKLKSRIEIRIKRFLKKIFS